MKPTTRGYERVKAMDDAVAAVCRRLRIEKFEHILSIRVDTGDVTTVVVQTSNPAEVHAIAAYFGLKGGEATLSAAMIYPASQVAGLPGVKVSVFGPTEEWA